MKFSTHGLLALILVMISSSFAFADLKSGLYSSTANCSAKVDTYNNGTSEVILNSKDSMVGIFTVDFNHEIFSSGPGLCTTPETVGNIAPPKLMKKVTSQSIIYSGGCSTPNVDAQVVFTVDRKTGVLTSFKYLNRLAGFFGIKTTKTNLTCLGLKNIH